MPEDTAPKGLSLGFKLALATVAVLTVISSFVFYGLTTRARNELLSSKTKGAAVMMDLFAASAVAPLDFGDDKDAQNELENLRVNRDITYAALWRGGASTPVATIGGAGPAPLPALASINAGETRVLDDALELVRPIRRPDGSPLGLALVRFSLVPELTELQSARRGIFLATAGIAALVALLIIGIAQAQIVLPLERLVTAARRLESGQRSVRVDVETKDEIGRLASAFNTMSDAIRDREQHLANATRRLRELFDNMLQGIVVFGPDGLVEEAPSKQAGVLFGGDAAGRSIRDLLYADAPEGNPARQAFEAWLECVFDTSANDWGELSELAPKQVRRRAGGEAQWLELQFAPVVQGDRIERIMLLATDVSDQKRLERAAHTREEAHAGQMQVMRRLLAGGGQVFATFLDAADARVAASLQQVKKQLGAAELTEILQRVHTLRGEARTFELPELSAECQGIERLLREAGGSGAINLRAGGEQKPELVVRLERARLMVARARELFIEASPIGAAVLDQMTVRRSDVERLPKLLGVQSDGVNRLIASLSSRPFGECVMSLEAAAPRWAEEVGKKVKLVVEGRDARVPSKLAPVLTSILPHLVRNAVAHGIEDPASRRSAGKPEMGALYVSAKEGAEALTVCVRDDGRGIDEAAIHQRAKELGLPAAPATELVFAPGLSTVALGELAGQGMGLSAVRSELRRAGCEVRASSERGAGTELVMLAPFTAEG